MAAAFFNNVITYVTKERKIRDDITFSTRKGLSRCLYRWNPRDSLQAAHTSSSCSSSFKRVSKKRPGELWSPNVMLALCPAEMGCLPPQAQGLLRRRRAPRTCIPYHLQLTFTSCAWQIKILSEVFNCYEIEKGFNKDEMILFFMS